METLLMERYELAMERIGQIKEEQCVCAKLVEYFHTVAVFLVNIGEYYQFVQSGGLTTAAMTELQMWNRCLYEDVFTANYDRSYTNPAYAVEMFGEEYGQFFSALFAEMRSLIILATEQRREEIVIRLELFVEIYGACVYEWQESESLPLYESLRQMLYWYVSDYTDVTYETLVRGRLISGESYIQGVLREANLQNNAYLYRYGEYVSQKDIERATFFRGLSQEKIAEIAYTYVERYQKELEQADASLTGKRVIEISYLLGMERVVVKVMECLAAMGLEAVFGRKAAGILLGCDEKTGITGGSPNEQYGFDHKEDMALIWDKAIAQRMLEVTKTVYEKYRLEAAGYGGLLVLEPAHMKDDVFKPITKNEAVSFSAKQQKHFDEYKEQMGELQKEYISDHIW